LPFPLADVPLNLGHRPKEILTPPRTYLRTVQSPIYLVRQVQILRSLGLGDKTLRQGQRAGLANRQTTHSTIAVDELHAFAGEKGVYWRSRRSASFCRSQGKLSVDMTLSAQYARQVWHPCHFDRSGEISFYFELWQAITVSGFISAQTIIIIA